MTNLPGPQRFASLLVAALFLAGISAAAQQRFEGRVRLGPGDALEVAAEYHDPADLDARLDRTSIVPMRLTVTNRSAQDVRLDYADVTLDVGSGSGLQRLSPIEPAKARAQLVRDGRYNRFLSLLGQQTDRFTRIDPFADTLPSGTLAPGKTKRGYVFFARPPVAAFTSFLALGTTASPAKILTTNAVDVMAPEVDAMEQWRNRFSAAHAWARDQIQAIVNGPPPFRTSYALLMGVSDYRYLPALPRVRDDLDRMAAALRRAGFTVVRIDNTKLTLANVRSPQEFFEQRSITGDDRLLVFFAGHGFRQTDRGRVRGFLALAGAKTGEASPETTIAMDDFVAWTQRVPAKHLLVLLESCFSGLAVGGRDIQLMGEDAAPPRPANAAAFYQLAKDPGRYLLMAGDENQRVPMSDAWGGGLFVDALVKGLAGRADADRDGFVTARELYPWVRTYVSSEARRVLNADVTPLIKDLDQVVSKGEFVFTSTP